MMIARCDGCKKEEHPSNGDLPFMWFRVTTEVTSFSSPGEWFACSPECLELVAERVSVER